MRPGYLRIFRVAILLAGCLLFAVLLVAQTKRSHQPDIDMTNDKGGGNGDKSRRKTGSIKFNNRIAAPLGASARKSASMTSSDKVVDLDLGPGGRYWEPIAGDPGYLDIPLDEVLIPDLVPADIHFLWCGERWFEFKHYLSVMSVRRAIQPEKIYIHFERGPKADRVYYNQWMDELKHEYPWLYMLQMDSHLARYCTQPVDRQLRLRLIAEVLSLDRGGGGGGMFVGTSTWIVNFPPSMRAVDLDLSVDEDAAEGYVILRAGVVNSSTTDPDGGIQRASHMTGSSRVRRRSSCARIHHVYRQPDLVNRDGLCFIVAGDGFNRIFPADIWELDDDFGRLARRLYYGTEKIRRPVSSQTDLVPNIGHMIWVGGGRMSYVFYLSVVSLLYVARVDAVYIHGDKPPIGEHYDELMRQPQTKDRVKFIKRTLPVQVYQGHVPVWWAALQSDLIRVDLMIKYGGIYTDTDAIWVQPLTNEERGYDAVASFDWVDWSWPFPDSVNFGVSYGKRTAPFWRIFRDSMRKLRNDIHGFTGVMMPYKLLEKYPHLLSIDRHLQVICYHSRCHPTYVNDYHNESKDHTNMHYLTNWRQDVHAFHWTFPDPPELLNRSSLLSSSGLFADIGRFVLEKAGLL